MQIPQLYYPSADLVLLASLQSRVEVNSLGAKSATVMLFIAPLREQ